ncbi:MAG: ActS/PrrB/RegB family redox-sensitive histidine kinase [Hyphomicrobiaceae bacterium]|nr:ActS/PrrB/RegB family redox-sensitive histidine kinase [Hyphomicrobiaceae bacterium]
MDGERAFQVSSATAALGMRTDTAVRLRWLGVFDQLIAVLVVVALDMDLLVWPVIALIALSAALNTVLDVKARPAHRLGPRPAAALLAFDVIQLGALLALTGGLANPFSVMLLAPALIGVVNLPVREAAAVGFLAALVLTVTGLWHAPLPWYAGEQVVLPDAYRLGVWVALVLSLAFIGLYAFRVAHEARQMADALAATELVLQREDYLTALDGLAAAAAHELGTPLATITLVSGELQREHGREGPLGEDIALIRSQAQRCREILTRLSNLGDDEEGLLRQLSLIDLVEEVATPHRDFGVAIRIDHKGEGSPPRMRRNPAVLYGLGNILENAVDFASGEVTVTAAWTADDVSVAIEDDGPGFSADVMMRLGEPYLTTRAERAASAEPDGGGGLGLGFFIAKTFLERSGGRVDFSNRRAPENGARVHVLWPRTVFEAGAQSPGLERTAPMG